MLSKKYEFDKEFSIWIQLIGEMDDFIFKIDKVLSYEQLFRLFESDLSKRYPNTNKTGTNSTPVEVILPMLVLKHLRGLSNGVEKRISFLKRCFGLQRCLYRGDLGFYRWVRWGIIAHNLTIISRGSLKDKINIHA